MKQLDKQPEKQTYSGLSTIGSFGQLGHSESFESIISVLIQMSTVGCLLVRHSLVQGRAIVPVTVNWLSRQVSSVTAFRQNETHVNCCCI